MLPRLLVSASAFLLCSVLVIGQDRGDEARSIAQRQLTQLGFAADDLSDLVVKKDFTSGGIHHTYLCQKWQGIEVWNGEIAVHRGADGGLIAFHHAAEPRLGKRVNTVSPVVSA